MVSFLRRLKERKLGQWALAYLAGAWVVYEATGTASDTWALPPTVARSIHVILLFGFFAVLVGAWYHGEKGRQRVSGPELLILSLLLVLAGLALSAIRPDQPRTAPIAESASPASRAGGTLIAALPFANLSPARDDAFLADAFHEEMMTQLRRIGGLSVISRTSVMGYRDPRQSLGDIAAELGATAVVEGSVEKVGRRLRVTVQLVDPRLDAHLWVDQYDIEFVLDSLLDIQREIAGRIAMALKTELTPADSARLETRFTESWEAYQAYQRGLYYSQRPHYLPEDVERGLLEFHNAVALDPAFALAWAKLAESHARQVYFWTDATPERIEAAKNAAARARAAGDLAPETRLVLAMAQLHLDRDAERAHRELDRIAGELPGHPDVFRLRSMALEIQGRFHESVQAQMQLLLQSPRDATVHTQLAALYWLLRDYARSEEEADRALALAPDHLWPNLHKVLTLWSHRGPTPETRRLVDGLVGRDGWVIWARYWDRMAEDEYQEAIRCLQGWEDPWDRTKMWARPLALYEGWAYMAMGDSARASERIRAAVELLEKEIAAHPDDPRYRSSLAVAYAALGRPRDASREGEKALSLLPLSTDAFYGLGYEWDMAAILTLSGDEDGAVERLENLLEVPSWISPAWLEHDFRFDPLRSNPRFQALLRR